MLEALALTLPLLVKKPMENFPYLPEDMCIENFPTGVTDFVGFEWKSEEDCPEYYLVDPKSGLPFSEPLPKTLDYPLAVLTNEALKRGIYLLRKKTTAPKIPSAF